MTKKEIKEYEEQTKKFIETIESKLNVTYWYYDNGFKIYRFRIANCEESLDLPRRVMVALVYNYII
jgi:hypothetical protein